MKPSDPTIASTFNTYRFADHKEKVIDLLAGVDGERAGPCQPRAVDPGAGMEEAAPISALSDGVIGDERATDEVCATHRGPAKKVIASVDRVLQLSGRWFDGKGVGTATHCASQAH